MKKIISDFDKKSFRFLIIIFASLVFVTGCSKQKFSDKSDIQKSAYLADNWISEQGAKISGVPLVKGKKFMITSGSILADEAAKEMIDKGGSAIDAAIAAELVLNVVEPQYSGIGGGAILVYYDAKSKKSLYFNGRETAPKAANSRIFLDKNGQVREFKDVVKGGLSVGTPGLLKMFKKAHDQYGRLPWRDLFAPAIKIANNGFVVGERLNATASQISYLQDFSQTAKIYLKKDKSGKYVSKNIGEIIINKELANSFKIIANQGIEAFYDGKIAKDIVSAVKNSKINPGYLRENDFKNYQVNTGELICLLYRKEYQVCSVSSANFGSITLLQILGILENFDLAKYQPQSKEAIHIISEASRLAYADRNKYLGDLEYVPIQEMLDKKYLKARSKLISMSKTIKDVKPGEFKDILPSKLAINENAVELPSTTHISIVDPEGNAVSLTSSIEYYFGSAISVDGFLLNNQLTDFSFIDQIDGKKVANSLEPGKQPRTSMSPTLVFDKENNLIMVVGSPGGPRIIQFVLKAILANLDWHMDAKRSVSLPNYVALRDVLELEKDTELVKIEPQLQKLGHNTQLVDIVSGVNEIIIDKNGLTGAVDYRRKGAAALGDK